MLSYAISWILTPWVIGPFIIQGIIAVLLVNWAIKQAEVFDNIPQKVHEKYPAFCRDDRKNWSKPKFYLWAIFLLFIRLFVALAFFGAFIGYVLYYTRGHDSSKPVPLEVREKCRAKARVMCRVFLFAIGVHFIPEIEDKVDYTKYLGPDYDKRERTCTLVSNHTSWVDIIVFMYSKYFPGFVSKATVGKVPLLNIVGNMLNCLYIDRDSDKENKHKVIEDIIQRQRDMEEGKNKNPMIIFPEGTTSNSINLMQFKIGGFAGLNPVKPVWVKYRGSYFHPAYDSLPFLSYTILLLAHFYNRIEVHYLPIFVPNDYFFENNKRLGDTKEKMFTNAIVELITNESGMKMSQNSLQDKKDYLEILRKQKGFH